MPKFLVTVRRTVIHTCEVEVSGKNEDIAAEKVEEAYAKEGWADKQEEWQLESEEFEIDEVNET